MIAVGYRAVHEMAAALERADASARVLGARALAARDGAGPAAAFSALAAAGPEGLVPAVGTGGTLAARHLEQAALAAASAGPLLPDDVLDALAHAVAAARSQSGGGNALDPRGAALVVRREVAAVRGLLDDSLPRDTAWHMLRLGTFLPRAAWICALALACATAAGNDPASADAIWGAAARVTGMRVGDGAEPPTSVLGPLMRDDRLPMSVARSLDEVTRALFALSRDGASEAGPLALARATVTRLGSAAMHDQLRREPREAIGGVLDALGALAGAAAPARRPRATQSGAALAA
jgi:uncharacterized alpha-E superfamily protein